MRASLVVVVTLLAVGCASSSPDAGRGGSLAMLTHLTARQQNFGVILDARTGRAIAAVRVNNPIRAAVPDGEGGWYIGGGFIRVNGVLRKRLAHIDANGGLDPDWKPEANGNGVSVTALARVGSRLYVAGDFAALQHARRLHFGALELDSGELDPRWRPQPRQPLLEEALLAAGRVVVAGGAACCSEAGSSVVALDASSGAIDHTWKPHVGTTTLYGSGVYLLASNGRGVLIRGVVGRAHDALAAGEVASGRRTLVRKWRPSDESACIWCTLMSAAIGDNRVFASVNGSSTYQLVAFSRRNGADDPGWRARLSSVNGFYGAVSANAVAVAGGRVYVTGDFDRVNGVRRNGFAALGQSRPHVLPSWHPSGSSVYGSLLAASGKRLLLGIGLARRLEFTFTGLKTYRPVRTLRLVLALNGAGRVRIGLGGYCDYERWVAVTFRCPGPVERWLGTVRFNAAGRLRYKHRLVGVRPGPHFIRFIAREAGGRPQPPTEFWFRIR